MKNDDRTAVDTAGARPRVGVLVVAYNAARTLARTLDRIPDRVWETVEEVFVFDDASADETALVAEGYRVTRGQDKLTVVRNEQNLGYGGNQKLGYRYAIARDLDYVVLLHGDGQYAPEEMERMLEPLLAGRADAVFGSRMMTPGAARRGGMPLYKRIGNRILTWLQNHMSGLGLTEWHSGYRAYRVDALRQIDFERNADGFHFDTEIVLQLAERGFRMEEVPIPVYYGDEICYVNGLAYAWNVIKATLEHRLFRIGVRTDVRFHAPPPYEQKQGRFSSHQQVLEMLRPGEHILDLGCEPGVARAFVERGCRVSGVGLADIAAAGELEYHRRDLNEGIGLPRDSRYDTVVAADVLEHLPRPERLLVEAARYLEPGGRVIVSVPNVAFLPVRLMLLLGWFTYGRRGTLDATHLRFFTRRSFARLVRESGYEVKAWKVTPPPVELLARRSRSFLVRALEGLFHGLARLRPELFAFQLIAELEPRPRPSIAEVQRPGRTLASPRSSGSRATATR